MPEADVEELECRVFDIHRIGPERLAALTTTEGLSVWLEFDDELFACGPASALELLERRAVVKRALGKRFGDRLRLAYRLSRSELEQRNLRVLASGGLYAVVELEETSEATGREPPELLPLPGSLALVRQVANQPARASVMAEDGTVAELVAQVDSARWFADLESLAAFNRFTGGREIHDAHDWLLERFLELPGVTVTSQLFRVEGIQVGNVVATLRGRNRPDDWFIVGGHYDSTSQAPLIAAPGAEDNASGCAGVLEIARIFSANPPEATMLFICYAGEEQGLFGSADHVRRLIVSGDDENVAAMFNLDMIGFSSDPDLDCLLQANPKGSFLVDALVDSAQRHTSLRLVTSLYIGGSDHVPYAVFGMPAVMSIENDWSTYPHYHRMTDTPDQILPEMAFQILRMNVGALARMTGNSDVAGCLRLEGEPLPGVAVSSKQRREPRLRTASDRQGCYALDPLVRGKTFKLRLKGEADVGAEPVVGGCARLLGEPLAGRRVTFRQPGEQTRKARSDAEGCFAFEAVGGKSFTMLFKGPETPSES